LSKKSYMYNKYEYLDPDYEYMDRSTGVLYNLAGITNQQDLDFFESAAVTKRTKELADNPLPMKNSQSLFTIHKYIFQDVYEWAGKKRTVEISKEGNQFFPTNYFDTALEYIDKLITDYRKCLTADRKELSGKLAAILDAINHLHPFREGNGRTQREFLRTLALEKGLLLNLNPPDNRKVFDDYMNGTIEGNVKKLSNLISDLLLESE
jgi:cell filamentation protein